MAREPVHCPGCGLPMGVIAPEKYITTYETWMYCQHCGWRSPRATGDSPNTAIDAAFAIARKRSMPQE